MQIKCYINCRNYKSAVNEYNACISPLCGNVKLKSHVSLHPEPRDLPTYISIYISQNASICTDWILYLTINHCLVRFFIFVPPHPPPQSMLRRDVFARYLDWRFVYQYGSLQTLLGTLSTVLFFIIKVINFSNFIKSTLDLDFKTCIMRDVVWVKIST